MQLVIPQMIEGRRRLLVAAASVAFAVFLVNLARKSGFGRRRRLRHRISQFQSEERRRRDLLRAKIAAGGSNDESSSKFSTITSLPFSSLLAKLQRGELKAVDVLLAYQSKALASTDVTNAVTEFVPGADEIAQKLDVIEADARRPLHGIPVSVKECYYIKGTETTAGYSQYLRLNEKTDETAPIVQFLQWSGAIAFCKTNLPQGMFSLDSRNAIHGITRHPLDNTRSPGGSSSGEGALVGDKASLLGVGSDAGGSLRAPAAWCGCFALKPSSNRCLQGGDCMAKYQTRIIANDYYTPGFMAQDVDTLVAVFRQLYSKETFNKFPLSSLPPAPFREELFQPPKPDDRKLTIGYCEFDGVLELVPAVKRVLREAKERLERQGHRVVAWNAPRLREAYLLYCSTLVVDGLHDPVKAMEEDVEIAFPNQVTYHVFKMSNWLRVLVGPFIRLFMGELNGDLAKAMRVGSSSHAVNLAFKKMQEYRQEFADEFQKANLDALLWPAMPCPTLPIDSPRDIAPSLSYLVLFNWLNWPAGICPIGNVTKQDEQDMATYQPTERRDFAVKTIKKGLASGSVGLPLAVQLAAPQFHEEVILRLMKDISK